MKRTILSILYILGAVIGARADTSTYYWQGKGPWTDAQLQAAAQVCDQHYGVVENGAITSANYKRCMLKQGWKYGSTGRQQSYIDPYTGMSCRSVGGGSVSKFQRAYRPALAAVIRQALDQAGIGLEDLRLILPHNVKVGTWQKLCVLLQFPI